MSADHAQSLIPSLDHKGGHYVPGAEPRGSGFLISGEAYGNLTRRFLQTDGPALPRPAWTIACYTFTISRLI